MARLWRRDASRSCACRACRLCGRSLVWLRNPALGLVTHLLCEGVVMPEYTTATAGASGITSVVAGLVSLVIWIASMYFARKIAIRKGRSPWLGLVLGLLLSWIGLLIVALLPRKGPRVAQTPGSSQTRRSRRERVSGRPHRCRRPPLPQRRPRPHQLRPKRAPPGAATAPPISTASEPAPPAPPLRVVPSPPGMSCHRQRASPEV